MRAFWMTLSMTLASGWLLLGCPSDDDAGGGGGGTDGGGGSTTATSTGGDATGGTGGGADGGGGSGGDPADGLTVLDDEGQEQPADFGCLGQRTEPLPGADVMLTLPVLAFGQTDQRGEPLAVPGMEVQVFWDNAIPTGAECGSGCTVADDQGDGTYTIQGPADAWFAYRVLERDAQAPYPPMLRTMEVNVVPGPSEWFNTIAVPVLDGLFELLGVDRLADTTLVAGRLLDCEGRPVSGAEVRLFTEGGEPIVASDHVRFVYFDSGLPSATRTTTGIDGRYAISNVPGDGSRVVVSLWGAGQVGCELAATAPDAMSNVRVGPLRADAPAACGD